MTGTIQVLIALTVLPTLGFNFKILTCLTYCLLIVSLSFMCLMFFACNIPKYLQFSLRGKVYICISIGSLLFTKISFQNSKNAYFSNPDFRDEDTHYFDQLLNFCLRLAVKFQIVKVVE